MRLEASRRAAYCLMMACACGAGEDSCSEGLMKKFNEAEASTMVWAQNGKFSMEEGI